MAHGWVLNSIFISFLCVTYICSPGFDICNISKSWTFKEGMAVFKNIWLNLTFSIWQHFQKFSWNLRKIEKFAKITILKWRLITKSQRLSLGEGEDTNISKCLSFWLWKRSSRPYSWFGLKRSWNFFAVESICLIALYLYDSIGMVYTVILCWRLLSLPSFATYWWFMDLQTGRCFISILVLYNTT